MLVVDWSAKLISVETATNVLKIQRENALVAESEVPFAFVVTGPLGMRMTAKAGLLRLNAALRAVCVEVLEGQDAKHDLAALADEGTLWGRATMVAAYRKYWILGSV